MDEASIIRDPDTGVPLRWHPEETLNWRVTDIVYRCPMCAANLVVRGWTPEQITGWFAYMPTTHFDAWNRDIAMGRKQCMVAIRK
eukprot:9243865-Lingulodinium_polyedra.AAC.1